MMYSYLNVDKMRKRKSNWQMWEGQCPKVTFTRKEKFPRILY